MNILPKVAVLVPAHNEVKRVGATVESAARIAGVAGVLVSDDGSVDGTAEAAQRAGALVVRSKRRRGKGAALELAADTLVQRKPFGQVDAVLLLDADLGESAVGAEALLAALAGLGAADQAALGVLAQGAPAALGAQGALAQATPAALGAQGALAQATPTALGTPPADLVIGILPSAPGSGGFGVVKRLAREAIASHGGGFAAQAPLSGQRALTLEALALVRPFAQGFAVEVAMTVCALAQGLRVVEVPAPLTHRVTGRTPAGFAHRAKQYRDISRWLADYRKTV